jgi:glucose-fructose oxidoreductase
MKAHPRTAFSPARRSFLRQLATGAASVALGAAASGQAEADPMNRKLGVALVGLGNYASTELAPALRLTRHCRLTGVVTGTPAKGRQWSHNFGFPESSIYGYDTMHRLAEDPAIDIVYVVTPNSLHAKHVIAAANAGKHVISEKPFTTTVAEAEAALAACRAAKVKLSIGYRLHFDPYHQELMRLAREKDFGALSKLSGEFSFVMPQRVWRAEKKYSGGGPIMDIGLYVIQEACLAAGGVAPVAVTAQEGPKTRPDIFQDVEETMTWTMEFANGTRAEGAASYSRNRDFFRAEGAKGWIEFQQNAFMYRGLVVSTSRGALKFEPMNQQAAQMDDFAICIKEGRESRVAGEMGLRDMKIIAAIYDAARTGRRTLVG